VLSSRGRYTVTTGMSLGCADMRRTCTEISNDMNLAVIHKDSRPRMPLAANGFQIKDTREGLGRN
jgi:hypothetical protein